MTEAIRWISGRRSDEKPGASVVAIIHAPAPMPEPPYYIAARIHCPFLTRSDMFIPGTDDAQCIELAIELVFNLFEHRAVRDVTVSLVPPDELIC